MDRFDDTTFEASWTDEDADALAAVNAAEASWDGGFEPDDDGEEDWS